jgi:hypothetical protein
MRVLRRAAVLMVLLGLSLGTPGIFAAPARSQAHRPAKTAVRSGVQLFEAVRSGIAGVWLKAGCTINPWGQCQASPAPQTQNADTGCTIEPWGYCLPGH